MTSFLGTGPRRTLLTTFGNGVTISAQRLNDEEKKEVVNRGARAVTQIQVSALSKVLDLLEEEVFTDPQDTYFIVTDDLDTPWATERVKYKLIRALIETVRAFKRVQQVKVIVAMRQDLATGDRGH